MTINVSELSQALIAAGITTHGNCNSNGVVLDDDNHEIQNRADVKAIIEALPAYDPAWEAIRVRRNSLLSASDWTQVADAPLTDAQKTDWAKYRQQLRDIPGKYKKPDKVAFPKIP